MQRTIAGKRILHSVLTNGAAIGGERASGGLREGVRRQYPTLGTVCGCAGLSARPMACVQHVAPRRRLVHLVRVGFHSLSVVAYSCLSSCSHRIYACPIGIVVLAICTLSFSRLSHAIDSFNSRGVVTSGAKLAAQPRSWGAATRTISSFMVGT